LNFKKKAPRIPKRSGILKGSNRSSIQLIRRKIRRVSLTEEQCEPVLKGKRVL
jgi:hypothetical protein